MRVCYEVIGGAELVFERRFYREHSIGIGIFIARPFEDVLALYWVVLVKLRGKEENVRSTLLLF